MAEENKKMIEARFQVSLDTRRFEIELFWKRSLFFWGFIASAFIGFASLYEKHVELSIVIGAFGMVCSFAWTMANRGSKYWQENWEAKVAECEDNITGALFKEHEPVQEKGFWLKARRYSVSKLAIALSDYVFLLWVLIIVYEIMTYMFPDKTLSDWKNYSKIIFAFLSLAYVVLMAFACRTTIKDPPVS